MAFCEDCGAQLTPGMLFCENCGAKLSPVIQKLNKNDQDNILNEKNIEFGILYTNLRLLTEQLQISANEIMGTINSFIADAAERNVKYFFCDVSNKINELGNVQEHIQIIKQLVVEKNPKYLFILGSNTVIPSIVWSSFEKDMIDSLSGSGDFTISSDLPYSTLDIRNPFLGQVYDFEDALRVGRLPNVNFENYFSNVKKACGKIKEVKTFSLSAAVWSEETKYNYEKIKSGPEVFTSPEVTIDNVKSILPSETNMFLINLHGGKGSKYWFGQLNDCFPTAMEPESFSNIQDPYFIAVEACYGAYYNEQSIDMSILLTTLNEKCISFLGSSRIAYGTHEPPGSNADVICGEYLVNLKNNLTAGDSFAKARNILMREESDPVVIKTLAEFSLYGDPSVKIKEKFEQIKMIGKKTATKAFSKGIVLPIPDVRRAVSLKLIQVNQKVQKVAEDFVYERYKNLSDVKPKFFSDSRQNIHAIFQKDTSIGKQIVIVKMDESGTIKNYVESK